MLGRPSISLKEPYLRCQIENLVFIWFVRVGRRLRRVMVTKDDVDEAVLHQRHEHEAGSHNNKSHRESPLLIRRAMKARHGVGRTAYYPLMMTRGPSLVRPSPSLSAPVPHPSSCSLSPESLRLVCRQPAEVSGIVANVIGGGEVFNATP